MDRPKILVVGSMNMDLVMYGMTDLPKWGTSAFCTEYQYAAGGKGLNQSLAVALQGADAFLAGRIGRDDNGKRLLEQAEKAGVRTDYVKRDENGLTGLSTMNMGEDGKYFSIYAPGANRKLEIADVENALAHQSFDMIAMQLEMPLEVVYHICELGRKRQIPIFLDAGPAMSIPLERLRGAFVISPNEAETEALTGIAPDTMEQIEAAAEKIYREAEPGYVLLKLGSRGAYLYSREHRDYIPGFRVKAIDTTAAGDTFGAAFCVQYCMGKCLEDSIRFAHAAAAVCVTRKGGQPSIPTKKEAEEFLSEHTP
ncbi:MAG: ribokinase [Lachnospiraceae bacterium]|nr:ribokinase [Lachnospiraceae bacterium]MDD3795247.1 ribokinase [Lachnospiraceae bacterium]